MTDQYFDWLLDLLAMVVIVATFLPMWPWPFDYWPFGPVGGLMTFLWLVMLAMDFIETKTGYYWATKVGLLLALAASAAVMSG